MIRAVLTGLLVLIAAVLGYAATRPDAFRIERSVHVQAPPDRVFGLIADFEQFNRWNPWLKKDPQTRGKYSAARSGVGASYAWDSVKIGSGRMTVVESAPPGRWVSRLEFFKPFTATNTAEFSIVPEGDGSRVNWAMYGPSDFSSKLIQVFMSMDKMVGPDFEDGLAGLKALAEAR
jgi:carbon monoxide dehydrogenase subunit G